MVGQTDAEGGGVSGKFLLARDNPVQEAYGNTVRWVSKPAVSGSDQLIVIDATVAARGRHSFHKHPRQDEVLLVVSGRIEQWLGEGKCELGPGDAVFVPRGTVHATFNPFDQEAHVVAVATPCVGAEGHEAIAVDDEEPWASLAAAASSA
jgi:quercetin dioxygenase-like cupin family protein